jgi:hypothetical protein
LLIEVFTVITNHIMIFWAMTLRILAGGYQSFGGTHIYCFHLQCKRESIKITLLLYFLSTLLE